MRATEPRIHKKSKYHNSWQYSRTSNLELNTGVYRCQSFKITAYKELINFRTVYISSGFSGGGGKSPPLFPRKYGKDSTECSDGRSARQTYQTPNEDSTSKINWQWCWQPQQQSRNYNVTKTSLLNMLDLPDELWVRGNCARKVRTGTPLSGRQPDRRTIQNNPVTPLVNTFCFQTIQIQVYTMHPTLKMNWTRCDIKCITV